MRPKIGDTVESIVNQDLYEIVDHLYAIDQYILRKRHNTIIFPSFVVTAEDMAINYRVMSTSIPVNSVINIQPPSTFVIAGNPPIDAGQIWTNGQHDIEIMGTYIGGNGTLRIEYILKGMWQDLYWDDFKQQYYPYSPMRYYTRAKDEYYSATHNYKTAHTGPQCDCGGFKTYNSMNEEYHSPWCKSRK